MMLETINKRAAKLLEEREAMLNEPTKTCGVKLPESLHARLVAAQKKTGAKSIADVAVKAIYAGLPFIER